MACQRRITNRVVAGNSILSDGARSVGWTTVASGLIVRVRSLVTLPKVALKVVWPTPTPRTVKPAVVAPAGMLIDEGEAKIIGSVLVMMIGIVAEGAESRVAVITKDSPTKMDCADAVRLSRLVVETGGGGGPVGGGGGGGVKLTTAIVEVNAVPSQACSVLGSTVKSMVSPMVTTVEEIEYDRVPVPDGTSSEKRVVLPFLTMEKFTPSPVTVSTSR